MKLVNKISMLEKSKSSEHIVEQLVKQLIYGKDEPIVYMSLGEVHFNLKLSEFHSVSVMMHTESIRLFIHLKDNNTQFLLELQKKLITAISKEIVTVKTNY